MSADTERSYTGIIGEFRRAMSAIQVPSGIVGEPSYVPDREGFEELRGLTQEKILYKDVFPLLSDCPEGEEGHSVRVAICTLPISHMLGFRRDERIEYFLTATAHDLGKLKVADHYPEKNPFERGSEEYLDFLETFKKGHVNPKNIPYHWGMRVASGIEGTHFYQKGGCNSGPYPTQLTLPRTSESELLSRLLVIPDFLDAVTSRPDKKTGEYRTAEAVLDLTMREYGDLRISYDGKLYTKVDTCGKEIVQELYKKGFIARELPQGVSEREFRLHPFEGLDIK